MEVVQPKVEQKKVPIFIETYIKFISYKLYIQRLDPFAKKEIKVAKICIISCSHNYAAKVINILIYQNRLYIFFHFHQKF